MRSLVRRLAGRRVRLIALLVPLVLAGTLAAVGSAPVPVPAARAASYVPISGSGSTWSQNAIDAWRRDVAQYGMVVNYAGTGSGQGRTDFLNHSVDFAGSDIPFQQSPTDGSAAEHPALGSYVYIPVVAGGTSFMYHLTIGGHRVTNLRLSGDNIAKIFTGVITTWNNPALKKDNPGLALPAEKIIPVVRSDSSGSSAQFSLWMKAQEASLWNAYYQRLGRGSTGGETSYWPTSGAMIAQSGDLGVAGYVTAPYAEGSIGYVEYSYALNAGYPVALMLNKAGYYTEPTPDNVAVSLLKAQINNDASNPAVYLTQNLTYVYSDTDSRVYPMSSYSYLILPAVTSQEFTTAKGGTLSAFAYYAECAGQQQAPALGYSPLPVNLVKASFQQILKIPGVQKQSIAISSCNNPTFNPKNPNANYLAQIAPYPPACDKEGPVQCTAGTGGARQGTPASGSGAGAGSGTGAGTGTGANGAGAGANGAGANGAGTGAGGTIDPATGQTAGAGASAANGQGVAGGPVALASHSGWGSAQTLMLLVGLLVIALVLAPPVASRLIKRRYR